MPDRPTLPPLPEPDATDGYTAYHSDDLLRAYGAAVWRCAVEAADTAWTKRLYETAKHLRENSLRLAKFPGMADEARARELAALYIGEIAALHEAKAAALRALPVPGDKPSTVESQR
jgi:hypothetical protein